MPACSVINVIYNICNYYVYIYICIYVYVLYIIIFVYILNTCNVYKRIYLQLNINIIGFHTPEFISIVVVPAGQAQLLQALVAASRHAHKKQLIHKKVTT